MILDLLGVCGRGRVDPASRACRRLHGCMGSFRSRVRGWRSGIAESVLLLLQPFLLFSLLLVPLLLIALLLIALLLLSLLLVALLLIPLLLLPLLLLLLTGLPKHYLRRARDQGKAEQQHRRVFGVRNYGANYRKNNRLIRRTLWHRCRLWSVSHLVKCSGRPCGKTAAAMGRITT